MAKRITIKAVAGRLVRDPVSKSVISSTSWVTKDDSSFWQNRIKQGDVELKSDAVAEKVTAPDQSLYRETAKSEKTLKTGEKENGDL